MPRRPAAFTAPVSQAAVAAFVSAWREAGFELAVFFDARIEPLKRNIWAGTRAAAWGMGGKGGAGQSQRQGRTSSTSSSSASFA